MESFDVTNEDHAREVFRKTKCLPFAFREITDEFRLKAKRELNEPDHHTTKTYLEELRRLLIENQCPILEDKYLLMFLRGRKFDLNRTVALIKQNRNFFIKYRDEYGDITVLKDTTDLVKLTKICTILPYRSPEGCVIAMLSAKYWNPDEISFKQLMQYTIVCGAAILENPVTQICGLMYIVDVAGLSWKQLIQGPSNFIWYIAQLKANPVRVKRINFININTLFHKFFLLISPFMGSKLRNRVLFFGSDLSNLHKHTPPEILPKEFGGHLITNQCYGFNDIVFELAEPPLRGWLLKQCNKQ